MFQTAMQIAESFESAGTGAKSLYIGERITVNQVHVKEEKLKVEKFAHASEPKEDKFTPEKSCYSCSKYHNPKFCPFKNAECHFFTD